MSENKPTPGVIVLLASGTVVFIASFLHWFSESSKTANAWSKGFRFLTTLPVVISVVIIVLVVLATFSGAKLPTTVGGLSTMQLVLVLSVWAALMMLCFLVGQAGVTVRGVTSGVNKSIGFWLALLGTIGMVLGAVLSLLQPAAPAPPPPPPPPLAR